MPETITTESETETAEAGAAFAARLRPGDWVGLIGPLGTGKSVFARGVGRALGVAGAMPSPSYTILNCHQARIPVYHADLYRIGSPDELDFAGLDSYFQGDGVCLVEWADRIPERWPAGAWRVDIRPAGPTRRIIEILQTIGAGNAT